MNYSIRLIPILGFMVGLNYLDFSGGESEYDDLEILGSRKELQIGLGLFILQIVW